MNSAMWRLRKLLASAPEFQDGQELADGRSETHPRADAVAGRGHLGAARGRTNDPPPFGNALSPRRMKEVLAVLYRYEGPFLDGEDAEWILEERERLHSYFIQWAMILVRHLGLCGQYHDAILLARHALRFDPYREELVRHLLNLFALDERRIDAMRYYEQWMGMIRKESAFRHCRRPARSSKRSEICTMRIIASICAYG